MASMTNFPTMSELAAQGKQPEVLFWVGCAGSFDERAKKITKALFTVVCSFLFFTVCFHNVLSLLQLVAVFYMFYQVFTLFTLVLQICFTAFVVLYSYLKLFTAG